MNYQEMCTKAREVVLEAFNYLKAENAGRHTKGIDIEEKGTNDFVTIVDKTSEGILVKGLSKLLPEAGFIAEEGTSTKKGEKYNWVIDPLDGTTNFIHGLPPFAISVALMEDDETVIGIVHEIMLDECFYAWKGGKSYLNGKEIHVSKITALKDALVITGFPYKDFSKMDKFIESMNYLMRNTHGMRRLGSAATDLAYVACGRADTFYEYGLAPYDVAAGAFIIERAGGKVSDFSGKRNFIFSEEILASTNKVFDEFLAVVNEKLMA